MSTLPKPPYLFSTLAPLLSTHDGDDRSGALSGALLDLLKTREECETAEDFLRGFDGVIKSLAESL
jgi:hypothetical protein